MRHACLTLKERLFMPNTLEKLLKKSSVRARLICHVQHAARWLRGLQKPNGQKPTPAASGSPDSARATSPTDRYVKCTSPLSARDSRGHQRWRRARASRHTPPATGGPLHAAPHRTQCRRAVWLTGSPTTRPAHSHRRRAHQTTQHRLFSTVTDRSFHAAHTEGSGQNTP